MARFSDVDLKFIPNLTTGRVPNLSPRDAIFRSLNHLLMVRKGEKFYNENFGIGIDGELFELQDFITLDVMKTEIRDHVENYEPRITVTNIDLTNNINDLEITIEFYLNSNPQELITFGKTIKRIR